MNVDIQPAIIGILFPLCTFALDLLQKRDLFGIAVSGFTSISPRINLPFTRRNGRSMLVT